MKKWLGLDLVDTAIHVFVTVCVAVMMSESVPGSNEEVAVASVFAASAVVFSIRRHFALKRAATDPGLGTGEMQAERIADLEARVAELELAQDRLLQLEERMDFSERLLVQGRTPAEVPGRGQSREA